MKNQYFTFILFILTLSSCTNNTKAPDVESRESKYVAPVVTQIADLPDSLKPEVIDLTKRPAPQKIIIPKNETDNYSYIDSYGNAIRIKPPEKKKIEAIHSIENYNNKKSKNFTNVALMQAGIPYYKKYTTDDGLPMNSISCAVVDKKGHIWFGTRTEGISYFDGEKFTNFSFSNGLATNMVSSILEDRDGNIWIGTVGKGLCRYDGIKFTSYDIHPDISNYASLNRVSNIAEGDSGKIWIIYEAGIQFYSPELDSVVELKNITLDLDEYRFNCIEIDKSGNLWLGSNKGVICFDPENYKIIKSLTTKNGLAGNIVNDIYKDRDGEIWFATSNGVSSFNWENKEKISNYTVKNSYEGSNVLSIHEDSKQNIWFAFPNGEVAYLNKENINKSLTTLQYQLGFYHYLSLIDSSDNLWFGTQQSGIICFEFMETESKTSFITYSNSENEGTFSNYYTSIFQDQKDNFWFTTNKTTRFDGVNSTYFSWEQGVPQMFETIITEDKSGNLWFGGWGNPGVYRFTPNSKNNNESITYFTNEQGFTGNIIASLVDSKGNIWFSSWYNGVFYFDGRTLTKYNIKNGLQNNLISKIAEDKNGNIWFGKAGNGLTFFSHSNGGVFVTFKTEHGLAAPNIRDLITDTEGNLWIATINGLNFIGASILKEIDKAVLSGNFQELKLNNFIKTFTTDDGLPISLITNIVELRKGKIALGSSEGVTIFDYPVDSVQGFSSIQNVETFNFISGFPVRKLVESRNSLYVDNNGILWILCISEKSPLIRFDYDAIKRKTNLPEIIIRQIKINEESISWQTLQQNTTSLITSEKLTYGKELSISERENLRQRFKGIKFKSIRKFYSVPENLIIPYKFNRVSIEFGSNELIRPQLIEYQYKLEGYDDEWSPVLKNTSATFGNIKEGEYTFLVKARYTGPSANGADNWTEPVSYTFKVLPPWHRSMLAYMFYVMIFLFGVWQVHRFQKARTIRAEREKAQKQELEHAKEIEKAYQNLEEAHDNLKSTQSQLIQSEKMASLGELTAGIAHEIQNPLNFVNNFSEINNELIDELNNELDKGDIEEAKAISKDIKENSQKINHHGKRADAIVKGMLQHSRTSTGQKELTNINALADEYLRLAYHGLKAKDKSFNVDFKLEADPNLPKINVIPQDIGRVLLNLINNAFYAVQLETQNSASLQKTPQNQPEYNPTVIVSTKNMGNHVEIRVKDNGSGIPSEIKDKIFQPFFTTKPTGQGTGLGLSLSYDIVKAHGGTLDVDSQPEQTTFTIKLTIE
jgi:signal transduction histidine kinase/ligand-binding sensor domain-containing protein